MNALSPIPTTKIKARLKALENGSTDNMWVDEYIRVYKLMLRDQLSNNR